ncbi:hypothetical protein M948_14505 [Virgibacillus sp. CM-4]|nr:hypothetical protein M948_14505 [Virgibacillus sp. CM-4]
MSSTSSNFKLYKSNELAIKELEEEVKPEIEGNERISITIWIKIPISLFPCRKILIQCTGKIFNAIRNYLVNSSLFEGGGTNK